MKEIPLTQGLVTLVDDEDFEELNRYKWHAQKRTTTVYAGRNHCREDGERRITYMHQQILGVMGGDHIDGDGLNNRRSNLRACTLSQNQWNRRRHMVGCSSQYKGVRYHGHSKKNPWYAQIRINNKQIYLGIHPTEEAAALAYNEAARILFGEFAHLNEI